MPVGAFSLETPAANGHADPPYHQQKSHGNRAKYDSRRADEEKERGHVAACCGRVPEGRSRRQGRSRRCETVRGRCGDVQPRPPGGRCHITLGRVCTRRLRRRSRGAAQRSFAVAVCGSGHRGGGERQRAGC